MKIRTILGAGVIAIALAWACGGGDNVTGAGPGEGALTLRLTDHPLWLDSVAEVNVYVVRIDARVAEADSAESDVEDDDAEHDFERSEQDDHDEFDDENDDDDFEHHEWQTIATPNAVFNLLLLRDGVTAFLGTTVVDTGDYRALRVVIDPSKSSIVMKDGTVLTGDASPFARFPSGDRCGLKIYLNEDIHIGEGNETVVVIDFDLEASFVPRGDRTRDGLIFRPVLKGSIHD